jgi:hypothetical protein
LERLQQSSFAKGECSVYSLEEIFLINHIKNINIFSTSLLGEYLSPAALHGHKMKSIARQNLQHNLHCYAMTGNHISYIIFNCLFVYLFIINKICSHL